MCVVWIKFKVVEFYPFDYRNPYYNLKQKPRQERGFVENCESDWILHKKTPSWAGVRLNNIKICSKT